MSKILIAGAGYGGLVASIYLAKAGYRVFVFEMNDEAESGYNCQDRLTFSYIADVLEVNESDLNPDELPINGMYVFKCLVEKAKALGVEFYFNTKVSGPVIMNGRIIGLLTSLGNATGDLVIDSAGVLLTIRQPLTLMVADGYAIVGGSAFMTASMSGIGADFSIKAGKLLADCVINAKTDNYSADVLWRYNREYHIRYGDELGRSAGLINGKKIAKLYKKVPEKYDFDLIKEWDKKIKAYYVEIEK